MNTGKVKKSQLQSLDLTPNPDLLAEISAQKAHQLLVGFAAEESANLLSEGKRKLSAKGLDLLYANDIENGAIFGAEETSGYLIAKDSYLEVKKTSKVKLATILLDQVAERLHSANV